MSHPYKGAADYQFWRKSMDVAPVHKLDPVVDPGFQIDPDTVITTAGSCFAQHISDRLKRLSFNYYVPESGADLTVAERQRRNFGVFSARYGNIYTTRQLIQLFQEAFGERQPQETHWLRPDGRVIDPYRPNIEPDGFASLEEMQASRAEHLHFVRQIFERSDVFIFTLGLTEMWETASDGSALPLAPGVVGGSYDPERYRFRNLTFAEVQADLEEFLARLRAINPGVKVLLTVSPVPLIATMEKRNVLVSTTYSKSVLRAVAGEVADRHDFVDYFPSYEIITGSPTGGLYYEEGYREVNAQGVSHAMRCFLKNYIPAGRAQVTTSAPLSEDMTVTVCDEEEIAKIRG